ncbi:cysteine desulfurase family protein [Paenactinomyces guangxiensis]|uniref:Cysteine desulfurase n=1 Tax=Paenactinomyces guangxiensis TaxID=1490290 RepID=A0A7W1WNP9_9BACL|nr:cysteine desulfurase family protein [Paenactinomyces guangxiensis]MBA4493237.1 cysteine desulfurase [Paenactinomyces guangxiensis]MBH8589913.1 cysteine desulfurase [Paenactinomyces guangxiensis]
MIYLDNSATTPTDPEVIEVMSDVMKQVYGNPSSLHGLGMKAERLVEQARKVVAQTLGCTPHEIIFTSGGTEANNLAIKGVAERNPERKKHLITTEAEHASVYEVFQQLKKRGCQVTYLPVDSLGRVDPEEVEKAITEETVLVSVLHVNNEVGTIQPIEEIGRRLKKYPKVTFHVDAVQSFAKIPLLPAQAHVDLLSLSAHKFHGPKGVGALYKRKNITLAPLLAGGGQEGGIRSGTYNVPGIAGLAKAIVLAQQKRSQFLQNCEVWKETLLARLKDSLHPMRANGDLTPEGGAPYIVNLSFAGLKSEVLVHALEKENLFVSSKSACSSRAEVPSRVLKAMGLNNDEAVSSIRISMGFQTKAADIDHCADVLLRVVPQYQQVMKVRK